MSGTIWIPIPHVPHGPLGTPPLLADADYLTEAAQHIQGGYAVGGSNLTGTVVRLLHDTAAALRARHEEHGKHWWACAVNAPRAEWVGPCDCDLSRAQSDAQVACAAEAADDV